MINLKTERSDKTPTGSNVPSPPLGRHTDEVLHEHGVGDDEIARLREMGVVA